MNAKFGLVDAIYRSLSLAISGLVGMVFHHYITGPILKRWRTSNDRDVIPLQTTAIKMESQMSGFSYNLAKGAAGSIDIIEAGGVVKLQVVGAMSLGGGSTAGVAQFKSTSEVDISGIQLLDAGLKLVAMQHPSMAGAIAVLQPLVDAQIANL